LNPLRKNDENSEKGDMDWGNLPGLFLRGGSVGKREVLVIRPHVRRNWLLGRIRE